MQSRNGHAPPLATVFAGEGGATLGAYVRFVDGGLIALGMFGAPLFRAPTRWLVRSCALVGVLDLLATAYAGTSPVAGALAALGLEPAGTTETTQGAGVAGAGMISGTSEETTS